MIVAKAVIPNQYWILKQDDRKVGNIEAGPEGFAVKINDEIQTYKTIRNIKQRAAIDFEPVVKPKIRPTTNQVNGYVTTAKPHNAIYDVKHQVPLWTKEPRSKSWYAAGWYKVKQKRTWKIVRCPKLIMLERYEYQGPFHSREEAEQ